MILILRFSNILQRLPGTICYLLSDSVLNYLSILGIFCIIYNMMKYANRFIKYRRARKKCLMTMKRFYNYIMSPTSEQHYRKRPPRPQVRNMRHKSRRYYIRGNRGRGSRIADKGTKKLPPLSHHWVATPVLPHTTEQQDFDTSSFVIGVDSHSTKCISNDINHFTSPIRTCHQRSCKGFGGVSTPIKGEGTLKWKYLDDDGVKQTLTIKDALYVPEADICLLSP